MKTTLISVLFSLSILPLLAQAQYPQQALLAPAAQPRLSDEAVIFHTDVGDIAVAFYPDEAPKHTAQILKLVRGGLYTHVQFFRTDKGFVTQVENHDARNPALSAEEKQLIEKIPGEFNSIHHRRGILSMARFDDPNSAESSFSFVLGEAPHLDNQYTVFGEVIQNISVLDEIEKLPPKTVYINSAEVVARQDLASLKLEPAHSMFLSSMKQSAAVQISFFTVLVLLGLYFFERYHDGKAAAQKSATKKS